MIRAVKYAATTGFSLPMGVRMKIRAQSALLADISPSRLTEEIFKIIRSSSAAKIAEALESFGLYQYLQPSASKLMKESPAFREKYLAAFAGLNQKDEAPVGENLSALVRDYLETIIVWEEDVAENYKKAFIEARRFVLPMNPPRFELDCAVRLVFKAHGVAIKRALYSEKGGRPPRRADGPRKGEKAAAEGSGEKPSAGKNAEKAPPEAEAADAAALGSAAQPKRKRRKRQKAKSAEGGPRGDS
jgi:poly(A) polymerase